MSFWLAASALLIMALSFVLYGFIPSVSRRRRSVAVASEVSATSPDQQQQLNVGLFREQQLSLNAQRDKGEIKESEYIDLLAEAQRRLLHDVKHSANNNTGAGQVAAGNSGVWLLLSTAVAVLVCALFLYDHLGAASDVEIANLLQQSQASVGQDAKSKLANQLHSGLIKGTNKSPDNLYYWVLLARLEQERGDFNGAAVAYKNALRVAPDDGKVHAELAQVLFSLAGNRPTEEVKTHANKALASDPSNASALGLLGIGAFAQQHYREAATYWQAALQNTPPMSSSAEALRSGIRRAKSRLGEKVNDWSISLQVSLPPPLVAPADASVFIYLREWQGMPMPLVARRVRVVDLPLNIQFDDTMALSPERLPSNMAQIEVVARIAMSNNRQSSSGDLEGRLGPLSIKELSEPLILEINHSLP